MQVSLDSTLQLQLQSMLIWSGHSYFYKLGYRVQQADLTLQLIMLYYAYVLKLMT